MLIVDAVNVTLDRLSRLPDGSRVRELREQALGYIRAACRCEEDGPPSVERLEELMKKVLALHVAVSREGTSEP